ncbi:CBS domain-containing protein [Actinotignum sp. GS-2025f]|uniref:CBS domain-containing protein n=1 Tax=Actinotignum TaxID=1653174 RepID=UPI00237EE55C|nr:MULTISPECIES: CBS domain-containing protein [Actinotignum]MDE1653942.1 CBS domain-containing protein [Actinotignum schaalii]MDY5128014.1 CBS domain-containing protein [Actinotignum sp. SLA_B059]
MHDDATSSTANSLTQRFLSAVEDLRAELDHATGLDSRGFGDAWAKAYAKRVPAVVRNHDLGEVLRNLRNTIAHNNYKNGQPIATPRADLVEAAERLLFQVRNEPQIQNFMVHDVATVSPADTFATVATILHAHGYAQLPVVDNSTESTDATITGLLTTNMVARWVAGMVAAGKESQLAEVPAGEILAHSGAHDAPLYAKPSDRAMAVCTALTDRGHPAVLITRTGDATGVLIGLVARADVGRIFREIAIAR